MVYGIFTMTIVAGKRNLAVAHTQKLAQLMIEKYHVPAEVLGNAPGLIFQCHLVVKYNNAAHLSETLKALQADPAFDAWWEGTAGLIDWQDSRTTSYEVLA